MIPKNPNLVEKDEPAKPVSIFKPEFAREVEYELRKENGISRCQNCQLH